MPRNTDEAHHRQQYRLAIGTLNSFSPGLAGTIQAIVCEEKPLVEVGQGHGRAGRHHALETAFTRLELGLDCLTRVWSL